MNTKPDLLTLLKAQSGDRNALNEVLRSVQQPLYIYLSRLTGNNDAAKDILQEVFLVIFKKIESLNNPDLFRAWVFRIASRAAFKYLKRQKMNLFEPLGDFFSLENIPDTATIDPNIVVWEARLPRLMEDLSPGSRAVIHLHFSEGLKLHEISEILDIPLGTVKSRLAYGLSCLRKAIEKIKSTPIS